MEKSLRDLKGPKATEPKAPRPGVRVPKPKPKAEPGGGRAVGGKPMAPQIVTALGDQKHRYAPVRGGRQKGALPIRFELPSEGALPYIFHRPVTGGALGQIELDCRRLGANRPAKGVLILGIVALVALIGAGIAGRRQGNKHPRRKKR